MQDMNMWWRWRHCSDRYLHNTHDESSRKAFYCLICLHLSFYIFNIGKLFAKICPSSLGNGFRSTPFVRRGKDQNPLTWEDEVSSVVWNWHCTSLWNEVGRVSLRSMHCCLLANDETGNHNQIRAPHLLPKVQALVKTVLPLSENWMGRPFVVGSTRDEFIVFISNSAFMSYCIPVWTHVKDASL